MFASVEPSLRRPAREQPCLILFLLAIVLKLWLISGADIGDAANDPLVYVMQTLHPLSTASPYGPGTGLFASIFYHLGIPFRIGIEIAFMAALTWTLAALIGWPARNGLSCALFWFALFNPTPAALFASFYSDQVWMVETMLGLSFLVLALRDPVRAKTSSLLCAALLLGFATITRSCFAPLVACLVVFSGLAIALLRFRRAPAKFLLTFAGPMAVVILGIAAIYFTTCSYNAHRLGYSGLSAIDCREYRDFYLCLQSVGEPTGVARYPIGEERRNLIAQAGPESKSLMEQLDRETYFKEISREAFGTYDLASGWFHFAVFSANGSDIGKTYTRFRAIEREIHEAAAQGKLKTRQVLPLPDARLQLVLQEFHGALRSTILAAVHEPTPYPSGWSAQRPLYDNADFTRALTRQHVVDSPIRYQIWSLLRPVYAAIYRPALLLFLLATMLAYWLFLLFRWSPTLGQPLALLARELFGLFFLALIFWYAFFDASGMPVQTRYMIYQNVMLPILLGHYFHAFRQLRNFQTTSRKT